MQRRYHNIHIFIKKIIQDPIRFKIQAIQNMFVITNFMSNNHANINQCFPWYWKANTANVLKYLIIAI